MNALNPPLIRYVKRCIVSFFSFSFFLKPQIQFIASIVQARICWIGLFHEQRLF